MNELAARCAGQFIPKSADDFIGDNVVQRVGGTRTGARTVALHLEKIVRLSRKEGNAPIKVLFNGDPGIGKSNLVLYLQHLVGCDKWSTTKLNGTQLKIEMIEDIARSL